jgi:hypothetical protein
MDGRRRGDQDMDRGEEQSLGRDQILVDGEQSPRRATPD